MRVLGLMSIVGAVFARQVFAADVPTVIQFGMFGVAALGGAAGIYTAVTGRQTQQTAEVRAEKSRAFEEMDRTVGSLGDYAKNLEIRLERAEQRVTQAEDDLREAHDDLRAERAANTLLREELVKMRSEA